MSDEKFIEKYNEIVDHLENTIRARNIKISDLTAENAELREANRWIPVSERLPDDTRVYDVAIAGYRYSWTGSCVFGKWIGESGKALLGVTHWKYRPQPPAEGE